MREVETSSGNSIFVLDEPGEGGASRDYRVCDGKGEWNPASVEHASVVFMGGGPGGGRGCTNEDLLLILIDRLRGFQGGEFPCRENAIALTNLEQALMWLERRERRVSRGRGT